MKRFSLLVLVAATVLAQSAALRRVYLLPMAGGLDQYVADWLTREKIMQVVTDAKAADVVMTDRLGEAFEQKLAEIYPTEKAAEKTGDQKDQKDTKDPKKMESAGAGTAAGNHSAFRSSVPRGTLFLVDVKSRQVVWSDHEKPPAVSDASLNREAERIAKKLQAPPAR